MEKVMALIVARPLAQPADVVRFTVIAVCALALVLAGPALPALGL